MFYEPNKKGQDLIRVPIKSCCVPRPIAWISTISSDGIANLAPYSQFQNLTFDPYYLMISANQNNLGKRKDTTVNIEETGEFVCNMVPQALMNEMNTTAAPFSPDEDEFQLAGLTKLQSKIVKPYRVKGSPVQIECVYVQTLRLPGRGTHGTVDVIIGQAVGIHIDDEFINTEGKIDIAKIRPLARLGYSDYTVIDNVFEMLPSEAVCSVDETIKGLEGESDAMK